MNWHSAPQNETHVELRWRQNVGWTSYTKASILRATCFVRSLHIRFSPFKYRATLRWSQLIYRHCKREPPRLTHFWLIKIVSIYIVANNNIMLSVIRPHTGGWGENRQGKCATSLYNSRDALAAQFLHALHHVSMACCTRQKKTRDSHWGDHATGSRHCLNITAKQRATARSKGGEEKKKTVRCTLKKILIFSVWTEVSVCR